MKVAVINYRDDSPDHVKLYPSEDHAKEEMQAVADELNYQLEEDYEFQEINGNLTLAGSEIVMMMVPVEK